MPTLTDIIARWDSGDGKPYKGKLIDWSAYEADPDNIGCMCAQGQVLHLLGGWDVDTLRNTAQAKADKETARLLNISRAHAVLLRNVNDGVDGAPSIVLTHPEKVLGDKAQTLLAFWHYIDSITAKQWAAARDAAGAAAWAAAGADARDAAWTASSEIQGADILRDKGERFFFLPVFGFASPDDIPPLPVGYGEPQ